MKKFRYIMIGIVTATLVGFGTIVTIPSAQAAPTAINIQSSSCPNPIKQGQTSGCVTDLQNRLKGFGYNPGTIDGIFGNGTLTAVKSFQQARCLTVDGLVGPATKAALVNNSTACVAATPTAISIQSSQCPNLIQYGQKSGCVTDLQNKLKALSFNPGTVDGIFGGNTLDAVKSFQKARCLDVDGIVGPVTKSALVNNSNSCPTAYSAYRPANTDNWGKGWKLRNNTDYTSIPCAAGSTLLVNARFGYSTGYGYTDSNGFYTNAANGIKVRVCTINSDPRKSPVSSAISANTVAMFDAAKKAGYTVSIDEGLRTYEQQVYYYNCYQKKNCNGGNPAAAPGTSNHEGGIALDLVVSAGTPTFTWLSKYAATYGFYNYAPEPWHWSPSGS